MARKSSDKPQQGDAYTKAIALLARREHSGRELKAKLAQRGFDAEQTGQTLDRLQSKDFQSDARFGEMLTRSRIEGGYGPRWILAELRTHGIGEAAARALIDAAEPAWPELIRRALRRRYGGKRATDLAERRKRAIFLLRRGFDAATVQSITRAEGVDESVNELD
jgi:regulatory protein